MDSSERDKAAPVPWGPYKEHVEHLIDMCNVHTDVLLRQLAGEVPFDREFGERVHMSDREYFADKVEELRSTANDLVYGCEKVDRWRRECGADIARDVYDKDWNFKCNLPSGHGGDHHYRSPSPAYLAALGARDLTERLQAVRRTTARLSTDIDLRRPTHRLLIPEQREQVRQLAAAVERIVTDASHLARTLRIVDQSLEIDQRLALQPPNAVDPGRSGPIR